MKIKKSSKGIRKNKSKAALITALVMITVGSAALSGCSKAAWNGTDSAETESEAIEESQAVVVETGSVIGGNKDTMLETGGDLFFKYRNDLWRMDKNSDHLEKVRLFTGQETNQAFWIYNNCLYFDLEYTPTGQMNQTSQIYKKDLATGEEKKLTDLAFVPTELYASEGKLYVKAYNQLQIFALKEDGTIEKEAEIADTLYGKIPEGCRELYKGLLPFIVEQVGYMPLMNGENLIIADKDGQNAKSVPEVTNTSSLIFDKDAFYSVHQKEEGAYTCLRYDVSTLESTVLFETDNYPTLLQYRDGSLYYLESGSYNAVGGDSTCYQVDVKTLKKTLAASMPQKPGMAGFYSYCGNFYVTDSSLYCQKFEDYSVYLEKTGLLNPSDKTLIPTALYQSPIQGLGTVKAEEQKVPCDCGEEIAAELYVEYLELSGNTEAVALMNQVMKEDAEAQLQTGGGDGWALKPDESWVHSEGFAKSTLTYQVSELSYVSDQYLCVRMNGYEYSGGAHGMPYRKEFIFDRNTGKQLHLSEIIDNSEEEVKKMVSSRFGELCRENGFAFDDPETLETTVYEAITMDAPFYLTKEGIVFYFPPYEIAPYAAGFPEITIPYGELKLKIEL